MMRIGIYPGSFDPITLGHVDIIKRSSTLMDKLIIGVLKNSSKSPLFSVEERVNMIKEVTRNIQNVEVETFNGLLIDFAKAKHAKTIIRGLRAVTDFEYELQFSQTNRAIAPDIDTIFFTTSIEYSFLSSSIVREIASYHGDFKQFVPIEVVDNICNKYNIRVQEEL